MAPRRRGTATVYKTTSVSPRAGPDGIFVCLFYPGVGTRCQPSEYGWQKYHVSKQHGGNRKPGRCGESALLGQVAGQHGTESDDHDDGRHHQRNADLNKTAAYGAIVSKPVAGQLPVAYQKVNCTVSWISRQTVKAQTRAMFSGWRISTRIAPVAASGNVLDTTLISSGGEGARSKLLAGHPTAAQSYNSYRSAAVIVRALRKIAEFRVRVPVWYPSVVDHFGNGLRRRRDLVLIEQRERLNLACAMEFHTMLVQW